MVYKFGGSSLRDAERMREVADIICSFPEHYPAVVLSAMGKTTNLLLECGDLALSSRTEHIASLPPLQAVIQLHMDTCQQLGINEAVTLEIKQVLRELEQLLVGICIMQDLTLRAKDSLVSFGERMSTRIFAAYLNSLGVPAQQMDAFAIGMTTSDDFSDADVVYEESLPRLKAALTRKAGDAHAVPIVTGFLGRGMTTGAVTTLGRGGSDLTATVLGAAMEMKEVQVWKDVDGVLTSDPRLVSDPLPVTALTFEEATELAYFGAQVLHPLAMQPAVKSGRMGVRVKNSYNRLAAGTLIQAERDMSSVLVTSLVLKKEVTLVDVVSTRMLGQYGFLAKVFDVFRSLKISVDVVATSEVSVSLTLDPKKHTDPDEHRSVALARAFNADGQRLAQVSYRSGLSILSLVCNVQRTSEIMQRVFTVLYREKINVQMMSQGSSKTNISLVLNSSEGQRALVALHREFFEEEAAQNGNGNGSSN